MYISGEQVIEEYIGPTDSSTKKWLYYGPVRFFQIISLPIIYIFCHLFLKLEINGRENITSSRKPLIIIANHLAFYDSFLFRLFFSSNHLPLRFMAVDKFDWPILNVASKLGIISLVYKIFGAFVVIPGRGISENLRYAETLLKSSNNVVIYPEGKIVTEGSVSKFHIGAAVLAKNSHVPVIPISLRRVNKGLFRSHIVVNIGQKIQFPDHLNIDEINTNLFEAVKNLNQLK